MIRSRKLEPDPEPEPDPGPEPEPDLNPTYTTVLAEGTESPKDEGWYELVDGEYVLTEDTEVVAGKTYYQRS